MWCCPFPAMALHVTELHVTGLHATPQRLRAQPGSTAESAWQPASPRLTPRWPRRPAHSAAAPASLSSSLAPRGDAGANDSVGEARLDVLAYLQPGGATNRTAVDGARDDGETALQRRQRA